MNDNCCNQVYVPIRTLSSPEVIFYTMLYKYKRYSYHNYSTTKDFKFKFSKQSQAYISELNNAYLKVVGEGAKINKNNYGELEYPKVSYKYKDNAIFICIAETDMVQDIDIGYIIAISQIYKHGEIKQKKVDTVEGVKSIVCIESVLNDLTMYFRENHTKLLKSGCGVHILKLLKHIDKYPSDSLCELSFNSNFTQDDIDMLLKEV